MSGSKGSNRYREQQVPEAPASGISNPRVEEIDEYLQALLRQLGGTPTLGAVCRQRGFGRAELTEQLLEARRRLVASRFLSQAELATDNAIQRLGIRPRTTALAQVDARAITGLEARQLVRAESRRDGDTPVERVRARAKRLKQLKQAGAHSQDLGACRLIRGEDWWWETVFGDRGSG